MTTENAAELRAALPDYVDKGRSTSSGRKSRSGTRKSPRDSSREGEIQRIRQWAKDNGYSPSSRGRISKTILDAYNKAQR